MQTIEYWRKNKTWANYLGRQGTVVANTVVRVAAPEQEALTPYAYLLIDLGRQRLEVMGVAGETFVVGDRVELVLRKLSREKPSEIINYGLKAKKIFSLQKKSLQCQLLSKKITAISANNKSNKPSKCYRHSKIDSERRTSIKSYVKK